VSPHESLKIVTRVIDSSHVMTGGK